MKLYEIPKLSKIVVPLSDGSLFLIFHKIDGAYSYCVTENGSVIHLSANTELEKIEEKTYKLTREELI